MTVLKYEIKDIVAALDKGVIDIYEVKEHMDETYNIKKDIEKMTSLIKDEVKLFQKNQKFITKEEYQKLEDGINNKKNIIKRMECYLEKDFKSSYEVASKFAIDYIKATKAVPSDFADIAMDIDLQTDESISNFNQFVNEAKEKGFYCEEIYSKEFDSGLVKKRVSYLMHNEAFKHIMDRRHNSSSQVYGSHKAHFLHFDPSLESFLSGRDLNKKVERFRELAEELDQKGEYFGVSRKIAFSSLSGRDIETEITDVPDIQFREMLTSYMKDLPNKYNYTNQNTLNIKTAFFEEGKPLDILKMSKLDKSEFFVKQDEEVKIKSKTRKTNRP